MSPAQKRYVIVDSPEPSPAQLAHVARLESEGYLVVMLPAAEPLSRQTRAALHEAAEAQRTRMAQEAWKRRAKTEGRSETSTEK